MAFSVSRTNDGRPRYLIAPASGWAPVRLAELWEFRELFVMLVWRQVRVRYKQTALGVAWAVIQPVMTMVVFSVIFGRLAGLPSDGVPYPVFAYCALLPWQLFAYSLTEASNSVVASQQLLTKIYFPRLLLPLASVAVSLVDFSLSFVVFVVLLIWFGVVPGAAVVTIPLWTLLAVLTAVAVSLWLSALNVRYRDVRYTLPFLTQIWLFATPVAYPTSMVPDAWRFWSALNPMTGVVDGFRWALFGGPWPGATVLVSAVGVALLLVGGAFYFRHTERTFADVI